MSAHLYNGSIYYDSVIKYKRIDMSESINSGLVTEKHSVIQIDYRANNVILARAPVL